ncbi:tRNA (adenosine(37)-N6)-threonylcarbamoyltransferase complex ATPase subunit type 1 TsaE [Maricaulis parjimensis]|uniref:tRNA (adenosine(37)-N6)-threonylcarbamoyltransferase complex ATPase subunit type 1 TsaE n=1 Tax=Maricaulis parjimensis TaxID=144023 RepID=UPI001EEDF225|nr:tRNA (adenosine(37)-N6)-threonylcarbamoyltransferase complex ATPase subunit type 1 TsaE [Maricaulis parjimensis]
MTRSIRLDDLAATDAFSARLAALLGAADVILLTGDLGTGKTTLARGVIARLCGVKDAPSPTYTIVQLYDCLDGGELWHADLYRIEDPSELEELGLDEAFDTAICLVEWPDRLGEHLPPDRLEIRLETLEGSQTGREARLTGYGRWETRIDDI